MQVLHGCTFSLCQTHIRARDTKMRKRRKKEQKVQKCIKFGHCPEWSPKWYKTKHLARAQSGPWRGDVSLESKTDRKNRFQSSKNDEKPCMIFRILLFGKSGFSDRLWQNDRFCCMICTSFWKESRSKEALEEPLQCRMCSLTEARSKIMKTHSFTVDTQKCSFWRQVLDENANPCLPLRAMDFPKWYVLKHLVKKNKKR